MLYFYGQVRAEEQKTEQMFVKVLKWEK